MTHLLETIYIPQGTQHGNLHQSVLFCRPTREPHDKGRDSWRKAKYEGLFSDLLHVIKGEPLSSGVSNFCVHSTPLRDIIKTMPYCQFPHHWHRDK